MVGWVGFGAGVNVGVTALVGMAKKATFMDPATTSCGRITPVRTTMRYPGAGVTCSVAMNRSSAVYFVGA